MKKLNISKKIKIFPKLKILENQFKVDLNYSAVSDEYRKAFPLLGPEDAQNFLLWCQEHNFEVAKHIDESNPNGYILKTNPKSSISNFKKKSSKN